MELLRGEGDVARDKIDAPKPKRRLLDIEVSDDESDEENGMDELARKYLCVPADTNTQAERVFSWMGWLLNKRRLSTSGETVSMQLFLKDNLVL